jgi:hypothetical protein
MSIDDTEPLKSEVKKQIVVTVFTIGTAVVLYYLASPDALKTLKMWGALKTKRIAQWQVDMWQNLADQAATIYNREKI